MKCNEPGRTQNTNSVTSNSVKQSRLINTDYQFTSNTPATFENLPDYIYEDHLASIIDITLQYTPKQYYKFVKEQKKYIRSTSPTFSVGIQKGFKNLLNTKYF